MSLKLSVSVNNGHYGTLDISITRSADINIYQFLEEFERIALAMQYSPKSIDDAILAKASEIREADEEMRQMIISDNNIDESLENYTNKWTDDEDDDDVPF